MDAAVRDLTPQIAAGSVPIVDIVAGLSPIEQAQKKAAEMALRARHDQTAGLGHFATSSADELPENVRRARSAQPDGSELRDSVQNDLGGGLWTAEISRTRRIPVHIEGEIDSRRGSKFDGNASRSGIWLVLGNKTLFVEDGDERTNSQRIKQATDELRSGGGFYRKKIGPRQDQSNS